MSSTLNQTKWNGENSEERRRFFLKGYLLGQYFSMQTRKMMDEIIKLSLETKIMWKDSHLSLRQAKTLLAQSVDQNYFDLKTSLEIYLEQWINPKVYRYYHSLVNLSTQLGYENFMQTANHIRRYNVNDLIQITHPFIEASNHYYFSNINQFGVVKKRQFENTLIQKSRY